MKQLDWPTRAKAARASVIGAATAEGAVRQINALLSELHTSHTGLFTLDDYDYYALLDIVGAGIDREFLSRHFWGTGPYYPGIGAFTRELDGHHFVDGVLEGSPAERAGLKYGDEILSVDGSPYSPIAAFRGRIGAAADLAVRRAADVPPEHLAVPVVPLRPAAAFSAATEASARIIEGNDRWAGYVHVWASGESTSFKNALRKFQPSGQLIDFRALGIASQAPARINIKPLDSLIVDMRGRVGGNIAVVGDFLDQLAKPYWGNWQTINRRGPAAGLGASFRGRSVLLIDQHTRSAAEIMAYGYRQSGLGTVLGTRSAGAVLSGQLVLMPGDLLLYVPVSGHAFDGHPLEGVGVTPDHVVARPLPYAAGADPVLDAAVELLTDAAAK